MSECSSVVFSVSVNGTVVGEAELPIVSLVNAGAVVGTRIPFTVNEELALTAAVALEHRPYLEGCRVPDEQLEFLYEEPWPCDLG